MYIPSISVIICLIFTCYIAHSVYTLVALFRLPTCSQAPCFQSYLAKEPQLQLVLFTSSTSNPLNSEVSKIHSIQNFNCNNALQRTLHINIPAETRRNGTLYMHFILTADSRKDFTWKSLKQTDPTVIQKMRLTEYKLPKTTTFGLLGDEAKQKKASSNKPVTHIQTKVFLNVLTDLFQMSAVDVPPELAKYVQINRYNEFLPILYVDHLNTRQQDLMEISQKSTNFTLEFNYTPIGVGKLKLFVHVEQAILALKSMGFSNKDIDEVKGIFSNTNLYLLCGTVFIGSIHMLFDFLAFKNDIQFWNRRKNFAGLSARSVLWCAFSQIVIFLYLLDEDTSQLVLIPSGIGAFIEIWKTKKIFRINFNWASIKKSAFTNNKKALIEAESTTRAFDKQAMEYLGYILYPLCICGAVYSLIYQPYKSWYSWIINSLVNGVYAFGFLFMLPQLFINYKMKSVATLPWRALMYKAFNTFIDDVFAFIITMPTSHRIACFRDDIVFIIYLYQRWLYPVDKSRLDNDLSVIGEIDAPENGEQRSKKDN
ncbi:lipid scramblase CLPTM1L [Toxorhynchites rutilus septentrionalis]|uniref:lipid scramblase CLPTM1L n=1 Tax=Toxorhynchites rutilus septentrionalis TaxID=329112 RepID=UPI0024789E31|nr:lipid scramblase CLPTM1L [Toxorhynchites rutilus septentrionalis]